MTFRVRCGGFFRVLSIVALVLMCGACAQAQDGLKHFHDELTDVSFAYPARWRLDPSLGDYLPTAITSGPVGEAVAKVGFPGIKGTELTEVEFVYAFTLTADEPSCRNLAATEDDDDEPGGKKSGWVTIHGVRYWHSPGGDAGLSHWATEDTYAAFLGGRCLLFEEGVHGVAAGIFPHTVSKATMARVGRELDAVMRSVVVGPRFTPMVKYRDEVDSVTFLYPATWNDKVETGSFPLILDKGQTPRMQVGFAGPEDERFAGTNLDSAELVYAVLPGVGYESCYARLRRDSGGNGAEARDALGPLIEYRATVATAGHESEHQLYAADPDDNSCFLFETVIRTSNGDARARPLTRADRERLRGELGRVVKSVAIDRR